MIAEQNMGRDRPRLDSQTDRRQTDRLKFKRLDEREISPGH